MGPTDYASDGQCWREFLKPKEQKQRVKNTDSQTNRYLIFKKIKKTQWRCEAEKVVLPRKKVEQNMA